MLATNPALDQLHPPCCAYGFHRCTFLIAEFVRTQVLAARDLRTPQRPRREDGRVIRDRMRRRYERREGRIPSKGRVHSGSKGSKESSIGHPQPTPRSADTKIIECLHNPRSEPSSSVQRICPAPIPRNAMPLTSQPHSRGTSSPPNTKLLAVTEADACM